MQRHIRLGRWGASAAAFVAVGALAGCGSSSSDSSTTSAASTGAAAATAPAAGGAVPAAVAQRVADAEKPISAWPGPKTPVKVQPGRNVVVVTCGSQGIGCVRAAAGATEAGKKLGWTVRTVDGKSDPSVWNSAIQDAVAAKADGIVLDAVPPALVQGALAKAKAAGIPLVSVFNPVPADPGSVFDYVRPNHAEQGRLMADWVTADSGGDAHVLVVRAPEFPELLQRHEAFTKELSSACPKCKVAGTVDMTLGTMAQRLPQAVISALQRDPSIDYIVAPIDSAATFVSEGVRSAGKTDKVKVSGYEGDPDAVTRVRDGDVQAATVADPPEWMGWQAMDALARAFADQDPETVEVPSRLLVKDNAPDTKGWQGDIDFRTQLGQLWGT
jgi:ribose transport system substrate-binding protein